MPAAVKLVNLAVSVPDPQWNGGHTFLHQAVDGVHSGKPVPRDPTATVPVDLIGPAFTTFAVPARGCVWDGEKMSAERKLSADDQARLIRHDWAMHSDVALPAFVLPADTSKASVELAKAVQARFAAHAPDEAKAQAVGQAFQTAGRSSHDASRAFAYYQRAVDLTPHLWLPGDEGAELTDLDLLQLLAAQEHEKWHEALERITGPTALLLNGGRDNVFNQHMTTSTQATASTYMSHSANTTTPVASDTTLTGEILTSGGGLVPGQATYAHTTSANTATQTLTRTANGSDSLPVNLGQIGMRTASAGGGTLTTKDLLSSTATLSVSGDAITTTLTTTLTPT